MFIPVHIRSMWQGNVFIRICHSVHGGWVLSGARGTEELCGIEGVSAQDGVCLGGVFAHSTPPNTVNRRAVCILLEDILV